MDFANSSHSLDKNAYNVYNVYINNNTEKGDKNMSVSETKKRHNLTLSPEIWTILSELKKINGKSICEIIEDAVKKMVKHEKINPVYFKIMSSTPYCDNKENIELTKVLDEMTEHDLEVVEEYEL